MSTPTYPSKRFFAAGAKKASAWGTAVQLGAGFGILIENDGNPVLKRPYEPHDDMDSVMPLDGDLSLIDPIDFSPEFKMRYDPGPLGSLIAALFGGAGVPEGMYVVSAANNKIDFDEGGSELTATVASGTYTGTELAVAIAAALNAAPGKALTYTCTYSAATNKFTIGAGSTFTIRWSTGTHKATDISTLCGYSDAADDTGASSYVSDTEGVGTAKKHVFTWADYVSSFFTFAVERPGTVREVPSCVPFKLNLKFEKGFIKSTISLRGNNCVDGGVNGAAQMDAITYVDRGNRMRSGHGAVWMNGQSGDALDSGDALEISDMEISYERAVDSYHPAGSEYISQAQDVDASKISVKLTLPRTTAANLAYLATFNAKTPQKLKVNFTSDIIAAAGVPYQLALVFPRLKFVLPPEAPLANVMSTAITLEAEEAVEAPSGMSQVRPYLELVNLQTTDYLA